MHPPSLSIASEQSQATPRAVPRCAGCGLPVCARHHRVVYERLVGVPTNGVQPGTVHPEPLVYHVHCAQLAVARGQIGTGWMASHG